MYIIKLNPLIFHIVKLYYIPWWQRITANYNSLDWKAQIKI